MRIIWNKAALADRKGVADYYGQYNLASALRAGDRIQERVDLLITFPRLGHRGSIEGTFEFVVPQVECVVVYAIELEIIRILRIFHGGRERPTSL